MDAVTIAGGLVLGKIVDKMLADKVEALKDGKIRGAALAAVGIFGGRMLPANLKGVANGIAASGIYTIAKEVMPDTINGFDEDAVGQLSPAEVDLIESMAIESEVSGLDQDVSSTVTGNMDSDVMSTVTGMDEDEEDEEENF
jgi:hypothetical protein